ncbi:unnamed protein product [Phytomonas sp. Hart1]|nr:unnamed protein product [Phytomonas sp. Hart1]|eukprot:CCW68008.1 unnamed protein product [Phytomonas sp. isolate Hart1]
MNQKDAIKMYLGFLEELISRYERSYSSRNDDVGLEVHTQDTDSSGGHHSILTGVESPLLCRGHLNGFYDFILLVVEKSNDPEWWNVCDYVNLLFSLILASPSSGTAAEVVDLIFHSNFTTPDPTKDIENTTHCPFPDAPEEYGRHTSSSSSSISNPCPRYRSRKKRHPNKSDLSHKLWHAVQGLLGAQQSVRGGGCFPGRLFCTLMECAALRLIVQGWCLREVRMVATSPSQEGDPTRHGPSNGDPQGAKPSAVPSANALRLLPRLRPGLVSVDFLLCAESWRAMRAVFQPEISPETRVPLGLSIDPPHTPTLTPSLELAMSSVESQVGFAHQRDFSAELLCYSFPHLEDLLSSALSCRCYLARQEALRFIKDVIFNPKYPTARGLYLSSAGLLSAVLGTMSEKTMLCSELTFAIIKEFADTLPLPDTVCELLMRRRSDILNFAYQYSTFLTCSGANKAHSQYIFEFIEELRTSLEPFSFTG